jgi:hypothetical protein
MRVEPLASQITLQEPKRLRDKQHLRFVAKQPCLVCGREPSDPRHLRFAQARGLAQKVSDEFTVPLCRAHHRELHRAGKEIDWWSRTGIEPLQSARSLWSLTHPCGAPLARMRCLSGIHAAEHGRATIKKEGPALLPSLWN